MTAGEIGVKITLPTNNPNVNIATYTCTMAVVAPGAPTTSPPQLFPAVADPSGAFATYVTLGTEFPVGGIYKIALYAQLGTSAFLKSWCQQAISGDPP